MKVSIFGLGYVGCVTAACLARDGHEVTGVDVIASKVEKLATGHATVVETGLDELVMEGHRQKRITATRDGREAILSTDVSIVCVGTPTGPDGSLDLTALRATIEFIGQTLREKTERHVIIMRSTVPAGTAESVVLPLLHPNTPPSILFGESNLIVVPEFLREGTAIDDYYNPPFTLVGSATGQPDGNEEVIDALFARLDAPIQWVPFREAEMLKAVCNAFHAVKVAFANEVGALCAGLSIDGHSLMGQFVKDEKLNISSAYLRPGLPFGGSCLPKDLRMLCEVGSRHGVELPLLRGTLQSNEAHLKRILRMTPENGQRRIGINGLAFKSGTDDLRESPIVLIVEHLIGKGYEVKIHDPAIHASLLTGANKEYLERHIPHLSSRLVEDIDDLIDHAEVLLLTRDAEGVVDKVVAAGRRPLLIDLQGRDKLMRRLLQGRLVGGSRSHAKSEPAMAAITRGDLTPRGSRSNGNGHAKEVCKP